MPIRTLPKFDIEFTSNIAKHLKSTFNRSAELLEHPTVLFVGHTKVGKSAAVNSLCGVEFTQDGYELIPHGQLYSPMSNELTSGTLYPITLKVKGKDFTLTDTPGFSPNHIQDGGLNGQAPTYSALEVAESIARLLAARMSPVKALVFVIDQRELASTDLGVRFKQWMQEFIDFIPNFKEVKDSILFIFNHGTAESGNEENIELWLTKHKELLEATNQDGVEDKFIELINVMLAALDTPRLIALNVFNAEQKDKFFETVRDMEPISKDLFQLAGVPGLSDRLLNFEYEMLCILENLEDVILDSENAREAVENFKMLAFKLNNFLANSSAIKKQDYLINLMNSQANGLIPEDNAGLALRVNSILELNNEIRKYQNQVKEKEASIARLKEEIASLSSTTELEALHTWSITAPGHEVGFWEWLLPFSYNYSTKFTAGKNIDTSNTFYFKNENKIRIHSVEFKQLSQEEDVGIFYTDILEHEKGNMVVRYEQKPGEALNFEVKILCTKQALNEKTIRAKEESLSAESTELEALKIKVDEYQNQAQDKKESLKKFITEHSKTLYQRQEDANKAIQGMKDAFSNSITGKAYALVIRLGHLLGFNFESVVDFIETFAKHYKFYSSEASIDSLRETTILRLSRGLPDIDIDLTQTSTPIPGLVNMGIFAQDRAVPAEPVPPVAQDRPQHHL